MTAFTEAWGGGSGPVRAWAPSARLGYGAGALAVCVAVPLERLWGACVYVCVLAVWSAACGVPARRLMRAAGFAVCLFLPLVALSLAVRAAAGESWTHALAAPLRVALRGLACAAVCAATMASLDVASFGEALVGLRLPRVVAAVLVQVVHQTGLLAEETRRMLTALRLRGLAGAALRFRLRVLCALPVVWLLRLAGKAERVGAAMEVRGLDGTLEGVVPDPAAQGGGGTALEFRGVTVRYREGGPEALSGVTLRVSAGERVALLGLNGSGKTTLLLAAVGLVPHEGTVTVCGVPLTEATARAARDRVGFLFGTPDDQLLFPHVQQDVAFSLERRGIGRDEAWRRSQETLDRLGVGGCASCAPHTLSQGQRQRVALAGALVSGPELLLLDEPSSALDAVGREELVRLLDAQGAAVVLATHDLAFARRVCRRFVVLEAGRVVEDTAEADVARKRETSWAEAARRRFEGLS